MAGQPLYSGQFTRQVRDMISLGAVKGWTVVHKFGANYDIGTSVEDVWSAGGVYSYLTSAVNMEVLSDSANDTDGGSGAQTVVVQGLDSNWEEQEETVTLDGLTPAPLANQYIRINRMYVATCGTYGTGSDGDITLRTASAGATHAVIQETTADTIAWDYGQTQLARYTVPAGKTAFISRVTLVGESNKRTDFAMFQRQNADDVTTPFTARRLVNSWSGVSSELDFVFDAPIIFPAKTDIIFQARLSNGANGRGTVAFEIFVGDV